ncbi:serine hydrolase [Erythrobacter sp. HKB08]|uniref:serine hydrolase n=1 Tax=Erythrobacter sp. HKB08 TaxID=2502843 RepID=UPI001008D3A1|nr:serine hydrolase [Erythrobacter sp. HKB08]
MKFTPRHIALAIAPVSLLAIALPAAAQDTARMDEVIAAEVDTNAFMGTVLVAQGDGIVLQRAYGDANIEWDIDNTVDTKFRIGSVTKQFTAVAILMLAEEGKIDLDAAVKSYWPGSPESWDAITVRHLLQHTSGIPNVTSFDDFRSEIKYLPKTREEMIERFAGEPLEFAPGEKFAYSNSGYLVLTALVEEASGESYESFLRSRILNPLGMANTGIDTSAAILPKRASGYSPAENGVVNADYVYMGIPRGAGAMYSTTGDLLKWQRGLFGGKLLKPESLEQYLTPPDIEAFNGGKYALGVVEQPGDEGTYYWHSGGIEGFNAWLGHDRERDITVAVLANLNGGAATKLGHSLMTLTQGGEVQLANERVAVATEPDELGEYLGTYALAPTFKITITQDENGLVAQATNQPAFPLFKESEDMFFLKVVDAKVRFDRDEDGAITGLTLFQNGAEMPGARE